MKILYACQATGNGHISRARIMAKALKEQNIQVDWVFSGRPKSEYFDMEIFGDYKSLTGITFVIHNNRINLPKSVVNAHIFRFFRDIKSIDFSGYDLLINDFEPVTAWAAKFNSIKSLGISNQYSYCYGLPIAKSEFMFKSVVKYYAPSKNPIGIHWQQFDKHIIPPIIAPLTASTSNVEPSIAKQILVYLPFYKADEIINLLQQFTDHEFHIYHPDQPSHSHNHLHFHGFSREKFAQHAASCNGAISHAGFEMASEMLQMGKKLLVEPLQKHAEQLTNGKILKDLNWANIQQKISSDHVKDWLAQEHSTQVIWPNTAQELVTWLKSGQTEDLADLTDRLWAQVKVSN